MKPLSITKNAGEAVGAPDEEALGLIARFTRSVPEAKDLYTFTVTLCDNEIDRDNERFSVEALQKLSELFVGVTGIFDHSMKSADQTARIYKTQVIKDESKLTSCGEPYTRLKAWCYMLRTAKNQELINEIEGGIKKEVSVSCSVQTKLCSVCGHDLRSHECCHAVGETVNGKTCHAILSEPTDAYEWSFVAVPAQKNAGVSKSMRKNTPTKKQDRTVSGNTPEDIMKAAVAAGGNVSLTPSQLRAMASYLDVMKDDAALGKEQRREAEKDVLALAAFTLPDADTAMLGNILGKLSASEVGMLRKGFRARGDVLSVCAPTFRHEDGKDAPDNSPFRI